MDNMWNHMAGLPYSAMNNGGMNGPVFGDVPAHDPWMGPGTGPGFGPGPGPGPCPWDGYKPMPPKPEMDCCAILRCIHQCMRHYMDNMPYEDPMAGYDMGYGPTGYRPGPVAGYGPGYSPGPNVPAVPPMGE